ncbi:hypothetical protein DdX_07390 [Ditylenchus destructor]|uniref:Uncharacterized protein n=1 Tax=Ditylenchus destructor TaxID=166010 RepID=A0AAD4R8B3_9BILA|nr:hypothetical protein DdX_07390 [Ditylenchus destructor]
MWKKHCKQCVSLNQALQVANCFFGQDKETHIQVEYQFATRPLLRMPAAPTHGKRRTVLRGPPTQRKDTRRNILRAPPSPSEPPIDILPDVSVEKPQIIEFGKPPPFVPVLRPPGMPPVIPDPPIPGPPGPPGETEVVEEVAPSPSVSEVFPEAPPEEKVIVVTRPIGISKNKYGYGGYNRFVPPTDYNGYYPKKKIYRYYERHHYYTPPPPPPPEVEVVGKPEIEVIEAPPPLSPDDPTIFGPKKPHYGGYYG